MKDILKKAKNNQIDYKDLSVIINGNLQNPFESASKKNILIYKDKIVKLFNEGTIDISKMNIIDAQGLTITPGLIDQHIHGGYGCDFNLSSQDEIIGFCFKLAKHGVTSIVATIMTDTQEQIRKQINTIKSVKKVLPSSTIKIQGIHLEGPFLSHACKGIHPNEKILTPNIETFKNFEDDFIKIVSYAPEDDKAFEFTKYLKLKNIVPSAGHSKASDEVIEKAEKKGLKQATHLFNAMTPLHHREPGIIGECLTNDSLYVEIIADGLHINPKIIDLTLRAKPSDKVILISDSLPLNCSTNDSVVFGGQSIKLENNKAVGKDGTFAGSTIFLDEAVRNIVKWELADFSTVIGFATVNVANNLGLQNTGYIKEGNIADITLWDKDLNIQKTIINGQMSK